jgi:hypothetical protein
MVSAMTWFGAVARGGSDRMRAGLVGLGLLLGAGSGCTTNHDALARMPEAGTSSGGGGSSGFGAGGVGNTGDMPSQGGRVNPDNEPPGDDVLTIVNGIVDAPSVALCFAHADANGEPGELVGSPLSELAYAASTVLTELEGLSFADDAVVPWAIVGDLSKIEGQSCADAVALALEEEAKVTPPDMPEGAGGQGSGGEGGATAAEHRQFFVMPPLRARVLGALPAGTVAIGRSILMVLTGCVGGIAYSDELATSACGDDYTPSTPTAQAVVVKLSREIGFDKVGLQAVHAALAVSDSVDVRAAGDDGMVSLTFASDVAFGGIEPRPADVRFSPTELGVDLGDYGVQAADDGGIILEQSWQTLFESSGIGALQPLRSYTAVMIGPNPLLIAEGWWNPATFALVDNDPTRE